MALVSVPEGAITHLRGSGIGAFGQAKGGLEAAIALL